MVKIGTCEPRELRFWEGFPSPRVQDCMSRPGLFNIAKQQAPNPPFQIYVDYHRLSNFDPNSTRIAIGSYDTSRMIHSKAQQ